MADYDEERPTFGGAGLGASSRSNFAVWDHGQNDDEPLEEEDEGPRKKMRFTQFQHDVGSVSNQPSNSFGNGLGSNASFRGSGAAPDGGRGGGGGGGGGGNSFAARMMAKMGYKEGQGLGAAGHGRLAPVDAQVRPQGAGLGTIKEKSRQAKEEEKRAKQLRGEKPDESSSEEERRERRERKQRAKDRRQQQQQLGMPTSKPAAKAKPRYRTAAEIEAESQGLQVPDTLKSLIDVTGAQTQLSSATLTLDRETEASKIARRAKRELEAFAEEWAALQERRTFYDNENTALVAEMDVQAEQIRDLELVINAAQQLSLIAGETASDDQWDRLTSQVEVMEASLQNSLTPTTLQEIAVASLHPLFRRAMLEWEPLEQPTLLTSYINRLKHILGIEAATQDGALALRNGSGDIDIETSGRRATTPYESMIYTLWLPVIRTVISTTWDIEQPDKLIAVLAAWRELLPDFIWNHVIEKLLIPRLADGIAAWKPPRPDKPQHRSHRHSHRQHMATSPHIWLFPWLPYLPAHHLDPNGSVSLLANTKRKLRSLLASHSLSTGVPSYLAPFERLFGHGVYSHLLTAHLLPRLSAHLSVHLVIDPADQDLTPLETVWSFTPLFSPTTVAELLASTFFPPFLTTLHAWLTGEPNYDEIAAWLGWWREQLPAEAFATPVVQREWTRALEMVNLALELGDRAAAELPPPRGPLDSSAAKANNVPGHGSSSQTNRHDRNSQTSSPFHATSTPQNQHRPPNTADASSPSPFTSKGKGNAVDSTSKGPAVVVETTFRDVVEAFAADEGLLLLPLREAHPVHGAPLLRLTAAANGRGGVVVCVRGDVLWARRRVPVSSSSADASASAASVNAPASAASANPSASTASGPGAAQSADPAGATASGDAKVDKWEPVELSDALVKRAGG